MKLTHRSPWTGLACAALLGAPGCGGESATGLSGSSGGAAAPGSIVITASGEALALSGYDFPAAPGAHVIFVDGWEVKFAELLVTVDKITLSLDPDTDPGDESKTGAIVAEATGPFAIDLHKGGLLTGKGGPDEQAIEIARLDRQNKNGDGPFDAEARYALSYDIVKATGGAKLMNLDEQATLDYELMKEKGYTVLYAGTATWRGSACSPLMPEFDKLPTLVNFKMGFTSPASYINCQNSDNDPAKSLGGEEHERGIVIKANQAVTAQLSIHTDHPFWEGFEHDSPLHFDPIAARHVGEEGTPTATLEDMIGVDPTSLKDKDGNPLPFRTCTPGYVPPGKGAMRFNTGGVTVDPAGDPGSYLRDLADFMTYNQSTQGHLNSDGLCFVKRHYPSPP